MGSPLDYSDCIIDKQVFERLSAKFRANKDSVFVFIGAGLSRSAGQFWQKHNKVGRSGFNQWDRKFPLWNDLVKEMAGIISADTKEWEEFVCEHDAIDIAQLVKDKAPMDYQHLIREALYVSTQDLPEEAPPAHAALIQLKPKTLVTSNLDQLLEIYYNRIHKDPPQVVFDPEGLRTIQHDNTQLIKMHGCISRPSSWVMTRHEYAEVWRTKDAILERLKNLLEQATCLFVGYSMRDTHFNALYDAILYQQRDVTSKLNFCVTRGPVNSLKRDYWRSRGLNLIGLKAWDSLAGLFEQL